MKARTHYHDHPHCDRTNTMMVTYILMSLTSKKRKDQFLRRASRKVR